jgi:hypothetical protein
VLAATCERSHHRKVRHVASGKQQRPLAARECREFFFEASVFGAVPSYQMRSPTTGATTFGAFAHRCGDSGVSRQT